MHADGLELLAPGIGDRRLAAVGQHDRRAVGGVQRIEQRARRELAAPAEIASARPRSGSSSHRRSCRRREAPAPRARSWVLGEVMLLLVMALDSFLLLTRRALFGFNHVSVMLIVLTIRSGSGRARSIDNSPFFRSAPKTSMPSASTKVRWNWRAAMPRWRYCRALVVLLPSADDELVLLDRHVELIAGEARDRQRDPQALGLAVLHGRSARYCRADSRRRPWRRDRAHARSRRIRAGTGWTVTELGTWSQSPRKRL